MRWLLRRLVRLPFGPDTQRAIEETVADALIESADAPKSLARFTAMGRGLAGLTRVLALALTSFVDGEHPMRFLGNDVRTAFRRLRRAPGFALFSILTLALGIGGTTAVYSLIQSALHQPLAIADPARMMNIYGKDFAGRTASAQIQLSLPDLQDIRARQTSFADVMAWTRIRAVWNGDTGTVASFGEAVSGNYFDVLGVRVALGRPLQVTDDSATAADVVVLSDDSWTRLFQRDPAVIGRVMRINDTPFEIVGVAEAAFRGVDMPSVMVPRGWLTLRSAARARLMRKTTVLDDRDVTVVMAKGRLKPGVSAETALGELQAIGQQLDSAYPRQAENPRDPRPAREFTLFPTTAVLLHESAHSVVTTFSNAAMLSLMLVLLVACTNIANLQLGRLSARRAEVAVKLSLGASRWRVMREMTVEALVVAGLGATAGLLAASWLMRIMTTRIDVVNGIAINVAPRMELSALGVALGCVLLATLVAGLVPAWHVTRANLRTVVASGVTNASSRWRGRRIIIAGQVAVSVALLGLAGVFGNQAVTVLASDTGVDYDRLTAAQFETSAMNDSDGQLRERLARVMEEVRRSPGVETPFVASGLPIGFALPTAALATHVVPDSEWRKLQYIDVLAGSSSVFPALGLNVVAGRAFADQDGDRAELTAVISRSLADHFFPPGMAVGAELQLRRDGTDQTIKGGSNWEWKSLRIVGVMDDVDVSSPGSRETGLIVVPFAQWPMARPIVGARMKAHAASADWMKDVVRQVDRQLPLVEARTGDSLLRLETMLVRVGTVLTVSMGAMALALGLVGLSGVLSHMVTTRTREIGIRIALGADMTRVLRLIVMDGMRPVAMGLAAGTVFAWLAAKASGSLVTRLGGMPPLLMVMILVLMFVAGFIACLVPARRAARVDPNVALRNL